MADISGYLSALQSITGGLDAGVQQQRAQNISLNAAQAKAALAASLAQATIQQKGALGAAAASRAANYGLRVNSQNQYDFSRANEATAKNLGEGNTNAADYTSGVHSPDSFGIGYTAQAPPPAQLAPPAAPAARHTCPARTGHARACRPASRARPCHPTGPARDGPRRCACGPCCARAGDHQHGDQPCHRDAPDQSTRRAESGGGHHEQERGDGVSHERQDAEHAGEHGPHECCHGSAHADNTL